jgi:hypothetical protein
MNITGQDSRTIDWEALPREEHKGESGTSFWRTVQAGTLRLRRVEYSAGFVSDHWCGRGHVGVVLEGELLLKLKDGRELLVKPGMGFHLPDDEANPHLASSKDGMTMFIVD